MAPRKRADQPASESPKPITKKAAADATRGAKRRADASKMGNAAKKRKAWEASPEGQARTQNAQALYGGTKISLAQIYELKGWNRVSGHGLGDQQLPGFENPHEAPTPRRWEDHSAEEQAATHQALKKHGTSIAHMQRDFGAQLDQAHFRAAKHDMEPHAKHFYDYDQEHAQVIASSAKELGVPFGVHAGAVALTSPNTLFSYKKKSGETTYPNAESASSATRQHLAGVPSDKIDNGVSPRGGKNQGYPANFQKVGWMHEQLKQGVPFKELRGKPSKSTPEGTKMFGDKTGPFHNSLLTDVPDFFVPDVHSGGGGMLPHLSPDKPVKTLESGYKGGKKSEREEAIDRIPNFHAAADYAARSALAERGMGTSVRQSQASQWGEEQIQRGERQERIMGRRTGTFPRESDVFRDRRGPRPQDHPGQGALF